MRDDPLEVFQKIFNENVESKNLQNHLMALIESLYKDLQNSKSTISGLQQQIQNLLKQETFGITSKYVALKEANLALKSQVAALRDENNDLSTQIIGKDEEIKKILAEKETEMQNYCAHQIRQKEELIRQKDEEIETIKVNNQKAEQQLYQEMEAAHAFTAMQLDQTESNYRKQLGDINKKLKDTLDTCNVLRTELFSVKEQCNEYKKTIAELKKQRRECDQNQESPLNNSLIGTDKGSTYFYNKYQPLEINPRNITKTVENTITPKKPTVYRGAPKYLDETPKNTNRNMVPPLIKLSNEKMEKGMKQPIKKRKLYNPDNLGYLGGNTEEK